MKFLGEYSKTQQIVLSTHDPYFVSWQYIKNGARVNRLVKDSSTNSTTVHHLGSPETYESLINQGDNWQKPQMLDLLSKEIFFYDNVLFLEGQEDVGLLHKEKVFEDTNINIFGYGTGGFTVTRAGLKLAEDLGIKKAATIIDGGELERAEVARIQNEFRCYKIEQWGKTDIRDKIDANDGLVKEGYFDRHGNKKVGEALGDFDEVISRIRDYFG